MTTTPQISLSAAPARRILIICRSLKVGGIERVSVELANALDRSGHDVHLLRLKAPRELTPAPGVTLHLQDLDKQQRRSVPGAIYSLLTRLLLAPLLPGSGFLLRGVATSRLLERHVKSLEAEHGRFDLIVTRGQGAFEQHWRWRDPRLWQVVESWPGSETPGRFKRLYLRCLHDGKQIVCVSPGVRRGLEQMLDDIDVSPDAVIDIPNPCDIEAVRALARQGEVPHLRPYIVHVARLSRVKQQPLLIRAYARAGLEEDLIIVGEGPMRGHLEKLIAELGLEKRVHLIGQQTNPYPWMRHARLFVLCSSSEGLGLVLIEALACDTPCVAGHCPGGVADVLSGELAAGLVENSEAGLAEGMRVALSERRRIPEASLMPYRPDEVARRFLELAPSSTSAGISAKESAHG